MSKGETRIAKISLGKTVELNPRYLKAKLLLAGIYLRERDFDLAKKESEDVLSILPENYQAKLILGNVYMYQRKFKQAQDLFESLIKLGPNNPVGYFRLGILQRMLKQNDLALANFEKAMSINPKLMDVFANIILLHAANKEFSTAIKRCDRQMEKVQDTPAVRAFVHSLKVYLHILWLRS